MDQVERDVDDFIAIGGQGTTLEENRIIDFSEEGVDLVGASIEDARLAMLGRPEERRCWSVVSASERRARA